MQQQIDTSNNDDSSGDIQLKEDIPSIIQREYLNQLIRFISRPTTATRSEEQQCIGQFNTVDHTNSIKLHDRYLNLCKSLIILRSIHVKLEIRTAFVIPFIHSLNSKAELNVQSLITNHREGAAVAAAVVVERQARGRSNNRTSISHRLEQLIHKQQLNFAILNNRVVLLHRVKHWLNMWRNNVKNSVFIPNRLFRLNLIGLSNLKINNTNQMQLVIYSLKLSKMMERCMLLRYMRMHSIKLDYCLNDCFHIWKTNVLLLYGNKLDRRQNNTVQQELFLSKCLTFLEQFMLEAFFHNDMDVSVSHLFVVYLISRARKRGNAVHIRKLITFFEKHQWIHTNLPSILNHLIDSNTILEHESGVGEFWEQICNILNKLDSSSHLSYKDCTSHAVISRTIKYTLGNCLNQLSLTATSKVTLFKQKRMDLEHSILDSFKNLFIMISRIYENVFNDFASQIDQYLQASTNATIPEIYMFKGETIIYIDKVLENMDPKLFERWSQLNCEGLCKIEYVRSMWRSIIMGDDGVRLTTLLSWKQLRECLLFNTTRTLITSKLMLMMFNHEGEHETSVPNITEMINSELSWLRTIRFTNCRQELKNRLLNHLELFVDHCPNFILFTKQRLFSDYGIIMFIERELSVSLMESTMKDQVFTPVMNMWNSRSRFMSDQQRTSMQFAQTLENKLETMLNNSSVLLNLLSNGSMMRDLQLMFHIQQQQQAYSNSRIEFIKKQTSNTRSLWVQCNEMDIEVTNEAKKLLNDIGHLWLHLATFKHNGTIEYMKRIFIRFIDSTIAHVVVAFDNICSENIIEHVGWYTYNKLNTSIHMSTMDQLLSDVNIFMDSTCQQANESTKTMMNRNDILSIYETRNDDHQFAVFHPLVRLSLLKQVNVKDRNAELCMILCCHSLVSNPCSRLQAFIHNMIPSNTTAPTTSPTNYCFFDDHNRRVVFVGDYCLLNISTTSREEIERSCQVLIKRYSQGGVNKSSSAFITQCIQTMNTWNEQRRLYEYELSEQQKREKLGSIVSRMNSNRSWIYLEEGENKRKWIKDERREQRPVTEWTWDPAINRWVLQNRSIDDHDKLNTFTTSREFERFTDDLLLQSSTVSNSRDHLDDTKLWLHVSHLRDHMYVFWVGYSVLMNHEYVRCVCCYQCNRPYPLLVSSVERQALLKYLDQ